MERVMKICRSISIRYMTDVCAGKMTLKQITDEVSRYMIQYSPLRRMVVDIRRYRDGYHTKIWIPTKDFRRCR